MQPSFQRQVHGVLTAHCWTCIGRCFALQGCLHSTRSRGRKRLLLSERCSYNVRCSSERVVLLARQQSVSCSKGLASIGKTNGTWGEQQPKEIKQQFDTAVSRDVVRT